MKRQYILSLIIATVSGATMTSCFKDEPLNSECDIEEAYIHADVPEDMFFNKSDSLIKVLYNVNAINFKVRKETDLTALAPRFRITEGATIEPANGSVHDFSQGPVKYTVTSEDGRWTRDYLVSVEIQTRTVNDTIYYDFEHYALNARSQYYIWDDTESEGDDSNWATGNPGFAISKSSAKPDEYPSVPVPDGLDGAAVKLTTRDTGAFGALKNMRLAAGNLFLGSFDATQAIMPGGAMKATRFGLPIDRRPVKFTGYYKYTPGETFQDVKGKPVPGRKDTGDIYAVMYRNKDEQGHPVVLYGDDVLSSERIVAIARLDQVLTTDQWTKFELEFDYKEELDLDLLDHYGYNLAVVFTSSIEGASFEGAIGSTMMVDKVRIVCAKTE